jgi:hypothetical protein
MIMNYHTVPASQCSIADTVYPAKSPCCLPDGSPDSDPTHDCGFTRGGWPQYVFDKYGFNYSPPNSSAGYAQVQLLFWDEARLQILADRPYIAWVQPKNNTSSDHTLVVHGFSRVSGEELKLIDPTQDPPDDWWRPWDLRLYLGDANNRHIGDIADIEP